MKDIKINEDFDIVIDHRNDLAVVEGREEFEQHIALGIIRFYAEEIGSTDQENAKARLQLYANRLTTQTDRVGQVASVTVEDHDELPNTFQVSLVYQGGQTFEFDVN